MGQIRKTISKYVISIIIFLVIPVYSIQIPNKEMHEDILKGIDLIYNEKFVKAEGLFRKMTKKWPDHPVGYFFQAVIMDATMYHYGTNNKEQQFFKMCDKTISVGNALLKKSKNDLWTKFFVAGAYGYKGTFDARYKRWVSAFRNGFEAVSILKEIKKANPNLTDVNMGIGTYHYWRSKLTKTLWWMPGVSDNSKLGINLLIKTSNSSTYTKEATTRNLVDIYIGEKQFTKGLILSNKILKKYPNCRFFLWGKAECLFNLKRWDEAEKIYRYILDTSEADKFDNHYNAIKCRTYLAKIYYNKNIFYKSMAECRRVQRYVLTKDVQESVKDFLSDTAKLLNKCEKRRAK